MASHGSNETERLKANIQDQLQRLLLQLQDLEDLRHELDDEEYTETKKDTLEQMEEFDAQLKKLMEGDMTLVSELGQLKLALRQAIAGAVQDNDSKTAFAKREPVALRAKLRTLQQDLKLGRVSDGAYRTQALEAVVRLKKLGEELTADERAIFEGAEAGMRKNLETHGGVNEISEKHVRGLTKQGGGGGGGVR